MATGGPRRGHWGIHVSGGKRGRRAAVDRGALGKAWEKAGKTDLVDDLFSPKKGYKLKNPIKMVIMFFSSFLGVTIIICLFFLISYIYIYGVYDVDISIHIISVHIAGTK